LGLFLINNSFANEKFLKLKGNLINQTNKKPITHYSVKITLDDLDSSTTLFEKEKYNIWLPANRKAKIYFIKEGYATKYLLVDASFIPAFAFKKKQIIELEVKMTPNRDQTNKTNYYNPFCTANFKASENKFILKYPEEAKKQKSNNFKPPFSAPVNTFKGAQPNNKNLEVTLDFNLDNAKKTNPYSSLLQGILFSKLNYCIFNERVGKANEFLAKLTDIDKNGWDNIKPFDSPEYGAIIMKTLNREKSSDTLFALGAWIGTSQLVLQSFTSNSKIIIHGKKLIAALQQYKEIGLTNEQKIVVKGLRSLAFNYRLLVDKYMTSMNGQTPLNLIEDELLIQIRSENLKIYKDIVQ
jgi:hypothetical protein